MDHLLKSEPIKGKYYAIKSVDRKGRREGVTIGKFIDREYRGCSLHGNRIGYSYIFARSDVMKLASPDWLGTISIEVAFDESEKDFQKVITQLQKHIIPVPEGFDPFVLFQKAA